MIRDVVNKIRSKIKAKSITENFNEWYAENQAPLIDQLQKLNQSEAKLSIVSNLVEQAKDNVKAKKDILEEAKELKREEEAQELEPLSVFDSEIDFEEPEEPEQKHRGGWDLEL